MSQETTDSQPNYNVPVIALLLVLVGLTVFFGKFWYDALSSSSEAPDAQVQSAQNTPTPSEEIPVIEKSEKPTVDLFVMAFCPFGNYAENTIKPVRDLLGDKIDLNLHYVVNVRGDTIQSLRGQPEVDQNTREVCVGKEYSLDAKWDFISYINENCPSDGTCWEEGAALLGLNSATIQACAGNQGFDLMSQEAARTQEMGASASPTLFVNGVQDKQAIYQYGKPNAYKELICSAFEDAPEECSVDLPEFDASVGPGSC